MKDIDKVTLTVGQLKKLISEANDVKEYAWTITELREHPDYGWESWKAIQGSKRTYYNPDKAYEEGLQALKDYYNDGYYELEVWDIDNGNIVQSAESFNGKVTEY